MISKISLYHNSEGDLYFLFPKNGVSSNAKTMYSEGGGLNSFMSGWNAFMKC